MWYVLSCPHAYAYACRQACRQNNETGQIFVKFRYRYRYRLVYIYIYYIYIYIYIRYPTSQNLEKYCFWLLALFYVSCFLSFLFDFRCVCWLSGRVAGLRVILHQIVATLLTTVYSCNNPLIFVSFGLSLLS